ncbi:MAG TPA: TVP38/TMEM64 family protein [Planctomycetota bacterium]|nr:TVP38/TMEM64 family protein [Planctomycetota bacterium]
MRKSSVIKISVIAALLAGVAAILIFFPVKERLQDFLEWVRALGVWGPIVLALAYVPACVLAVPGSIMTLGAGFAFGVVQGTIAVSLGSIAGVSATFFIGRTLARGWVEKLVAKNPKFRALDQAVADHGFKMVLLTRLSPVFPFNFLNYAYGLTRVRFRDYFFASWIGMLPGTILYVYLGSAVESAADLAGKAEEKSPAKQIFFWAGLVVAVVVTVIVTRMAKKALAAAVPDEAANKSTEGGHP